MQKIIAVVCAMLFITKLQAQHSLYIKITDAQTNESLIGATAVIAYKNIGAASNASGLIMLSNLAAQSYQITFSLVGYTSKTDSVTVPFLDTLYIALEPHEEELEEAVIASTRSSRTIQDIPTRVEFIGAEELDEKANMKPSDMRVVLAESTGIQVQQTSATSANASVRIQGLDGKYTQMLKDGFPFYSGASSGLGLLQTPPLDLKQVEVIKGASSTLYGGGAIAGLVNLISKTPQTKPEAAILVNATNAGGADVNTFFATRSKKIGTTLFGSFNRNNAYNPSNTPFTAIPKFNRINFNPKLFLYPSKKTTVTLGANATVEERLGGNANYIKGNNDTANLYYEKNNTQRISGQLTIDYSFGKCEHFIFKTGINHFYRLLTMPSYTFAGTQNTSFSEFLYANHSEKLEWILGANLLTDNFSEEQKDTLALRNYSQQTIGVFTQNTWKATSKISVETGFRTDYVVNYGVVFLPKISTLFKINPMLTSRIGGGFGYKTPTFFSEESERLQYRNVAGVSASKHQIEKSMGGNADINFRKAIWGNKVVLTLNQLFFYTQINNPLLLESTIGNNSYQYRNISGNMTSLGTETNLKLSYKLLKLFCGYTYTNATLYNGGVVNDNVLTPKHKINAILMFEKDEAWKIGLEAYYFDNQKLSDGKNGKSYVLMGFMAERFIRKFSVYINFENILDVRQTRFDTIYTGSANNPVFRDIYAPLDGFVLNGGIKWRL